jgi:hypothetical protein
MSEPKPTRRSTKGPLQGIRRSRQGEEVRGRDNRPGHYSVTGEFIMLPDSSREQDQDNAEDR